MSRTTIDRLASVYLFHPLLRSVRSSSVCRVPILMYHAISPTPIRKPQASYFNTNTHPFAFEKQMSFLHENGYRTVDLKTVLNLISRKNENSTGKKYVCITFDDGYLDFLTRAFPVLVKYSLGATVFLTTSFIGRSNCLSWNMVNELVDGGIEFGSHTVTHPQLRFLPEQAVLQELKESKEEIEAHTGRPVTGFAYPFAFPNQDARLRNVLQKALRECGYKSGLNGMVGTVKTGDDPFFLKRIPIDSLDTGRSFEAKLEGGYDWVCMFQRIRKSIQ